MPEVNFDLMIGIKLPLLFHYNGSGGVSSTPFC